MSTKKPASKAPVAFGAVGVLVAALAAPMIAKWEGTRYEAYPDPATGGAPWTICVGHTGPDVYKGLKYTKDQCMELLKVDMAEANYHVNRCLPMPKLAHVEAALTSAAFNIGPKVVCGSTLQRKALANDWPGACAALSQWRMAAGKVMKGLEYRRADERQLCETGIAK